MIYLHKILPLFVSPLMLVIFLLVLGIFLKSKKISFTGIFILVLFSLPFVSKNLTNYLETDYKPIEISDVANADAIIVLSGMVNTIKTKNGFRYDFNDAADRFISGIELFKNNKANLIVFTRGKFPWSIGIPEGEYL